MISVTRTETEKVKEEYIEERYSIYKNPSECGASAWKPYSTDQIIVSEQTMCGKSLVKFASF